MYFSRTFKALNFDFQIQGLSRTFKVRANPVFKCWGRSRSGRVSEGSDVISHPPQQLMAQNYEQMSNINHHIFFSIWLIVP